MIVRFVLALLIAVLVAAFFGAVLAVCTEPDDELCDGKCDQCPFPPCSPEERERRMKHDEPQ